MVTLRRTVRLAINSGPPEQLPDAGAVPSYNSFAANPSPVGLARFFELDAACRGQPDPRTGYLINIKEIDDAVRRAAIPILSEACRTDSAGSIPNPVHLLPRLHGEVARLLPVLCTSLTLRLTPHHALEIRTDMAPSTPAPTPVALVRTSFDLAAAHRLHCAALSPEENRRVFGKCNNPSGHGHNYRVEPCVGLDLAALGSSPFTIQTLERLTDETIIARFDHKHLNLDTPEFADGTGLNPSVENIARVFFELLAPVVRAASRAATLRSITVWETDRTSATYPG